MFRGLNGESYWAGNASSIDSEEVDRFLSSASLHDYACKTVDAVNDFRKLAQHGFELVDARMEGGGIFKVQIGRSSVALHGDFPHQGFAARIEIRLYARHLGTVLLVAAALETRCETHLHLRVDTARELWIGMQIVDAAAHLEKIERIA